MRYVLGLLFLISTGPLAADNTKAPAKITVKGAVHDATIEKIKAKYEEIRKSEPKLVRAELSSAGGESAEGSKAEVYRSRGVIKEIREEYLGEMGQAKYSIFYDKDMAFFVLEDETRFAQPMMLEMEVLPKPLQEKVEHRFYIDGGRLIRWIAGKETVDPMSEKFKKRESEIIDLAADAFENAN